ncbi:MAG: flagellar basal body P-ring formation chaperone FlgA [Sulfurimonas sp.]|nr:flagellar basal body P-ring formation chaperone FlgA [Sulfurimonas sp.]
MKLLFILFFTLFINLYANTQLKSNYVVEKNYVLVSDILPNSNSEYKLFDININRHSLRVKTKSLIHKLNLLGYKNISSKHNYTQFTQKSPINTEKLELYLREIYEKNYKDITILNISISPRSYLSKMPPEYEISLHPKAHLANKGIIEIKTDDNKKIFFNYHIKAKLSVIIAKETMQKDDELSFLNAKKESIMLKKFRSQPLQEIKKSKFQVKYRVKKGSIITTRDVTGLFLVRRGATVNVVVKDSNIFISFTAKAKQNGRLGESIKVVNSQGKILKVVVTAKNSAEIK